MMNIKRTCRCGQAQDVPIALAGTMVICTGCGQLMAMPALGIAVSASKRASPLQSRPATAASSPTSWHTSSTGPTALLLIIAGLLLAGCGTGLWQLGVFADRATMNLVASPDPPAPLPAPPQNTERGMLVPSEPQPAAPVQRPLSKEPTAPVKQPIEPARSVALKPFPMEEKKPSVVMAPPKEEKKPAVVMALPQGPFRKNDTFLQDVLVTQKSRFLVQGISVATLLQYRIVARYTIDTVHADGTLSVKQKVESATLVQADELTQRLLAGPVTQLPGTTFTLKISPRGEVTQFAGAGGAMQVGAAKMPGGLGVQMASLLDTDGWKELGQATFYQPEDRAKAGRWTRPLTHSWGPLGNWAGDVTYAYPDPAKIAQVKVPYTLKIAYQPPKDRGALPLQITASKFAPAQAGGMLLFDTRQGRTVAAEERFAVRGTLVLNLLGQNTPAEVEEEQLFQLRITAK
jgi:hypothetical protein